MRRIVKIICGMAAACVMAACSAGAEEFVGQAQGYGGPLRVKVNMQGEKITGVEVTEHHETQGVGTRAIEALPKAMTAAGTWDVDTVSGATVTSNAIRDAVRMAMGLEAVQVSPALTQQPGVSPGDSMKSGTGMAATGRIGPGTDQSGKQVYSFNVVFASASLDGEGRFAKLQVDQLEVLSPGLEGAAAGFSGFPGQGEVSQDDFLEEVAAWKTKGQQGENYMLTTGSWREQMDAYEKLFTGMTMEEVESWFDTFCSPETGRPLKAEGGSEEEAARYAELSEEEKKHLADVTSSATMSLRDSHGDILTAIQRAWEAAR